MKVEGFHARADSTLSRHVSVCPRCHKHLRQMLLRISSPSGLRRFDADIQLKPVEITADH